MAVLPEEQRRDTQWHGEVCAFLPEKRAPYLGVVAKAWVDGWIGREDAFRVWTEFTVVTVRGGGFPRGMPLVKRMLA
jgi:hypothetical protein